MENSRARLIKGQELLCWACTLQKESFALNSGTCVDTGYREALGFKKF